MNIYQNHPREEWQQIVQRPVFDTSILQQQVKTVLNGVKKNGDKAIKRYTKQFDGVVLNDFFVTVKEMNEAVALLPGNLKSAIQQASENIRSFHARQVLQHEVIETMQGIYCWRKNVAIEKVGLYIP